MLGTICEGKWDKSGGTARAGGSLRLGEGNRGKAIERHRQVDLMSWALIFGGVDQIHLIPVGVNPSPPYVSELDTGRLLQGSRLRSLNLFGLHAYTHKFNLRAWLGPSFSFQQALRL